MGRSQRRNWWISTFLTGKERDKIISNQRVKPKQRPKEFKVYKSTKGRGANAAEVNILYEER